MRLSTCLALELVVGTSVALGVAFSVSWGVGEVQAHWQPGAESSPAETAAKTSDPMAMTSASASDIPPAGRLQAAGETEAETGSDEPRPTVAIELDLSEETAALGKLIERQAAAKEAEQPDASAGVAVATAAAGATAPAVSPAGPDRPGEPVVAAKRIEAAPAVQTEVADRGSSWRDAPYYGVFHGVRDDLLLAPLRHAEIESIKYNRGGSSISLRIDFKNGARAAFKPQQKAPQTVPRKEIAAYRVNRMLGLNAVPPAIGRKFKAQDLLNAVVKSSRGFLPRMREEMRIRGGEVAGELSWWIPVIKKARIRDYEIDTTDGIVTWKRYLTAGNDMPEEDAGLLAQISSMVLFDFIINNPDRWSGANARVSEDTRFLYFMDNTMSFGIDNDGHRKCRIYFKRSQKFSRSLVATLRNLTGEKVRDVISWDLGPFKRLLTRREVKALIKRRDYALAYIDELIAEHGEEAILVFP